MSTLNSIALAAMLALSVGCVSIVSDDGAKDYGPAKVELKTFAGTYNNQAFYATPPNAIGLMGEDTLGGILRGTKFGGDVRIQVTNSRDIIITSSEPDSHVGMIRYKEGVDFHFENHTLRFPLERAFGSDDSPVIGFASKEMKWLIDEKGRLVVITRACGAGLVTIIPMIAVGHTVAVFERK